MTLVIDGIDEDFDVIDTQHLSEYKGNYRVIRFKSGYYALQKFVEKDSLFSKSDYDEWITVLISPILDEKFTSFDDDVFGEIFYGNMIVGEIMDSLVEADNSFNGKHWQLNLYLSEEGGEFFTEIITKGEGETLLGQMYELYSLEREQRAWYLENYPRVQLYYAIIIGLFIIILILIIIIVTYGVL